MGCECLCVGGIEQVGVVKENRGGDRECHCCGSGSGSELKWCCVRFGSVSLCDVSVGVCVECVSLSEWSKYVIGSM